jgi:hypothetical protein
VNRRLPGTCAVLLAATTAGCGSKSGPAGFCGWIGADVQGLDRIDLVDGTTTVGTWYHVFAEGITDATNDSRQTIASAVTADDAGFERVRAEAPDDVQPALDRLHHLLQDPRASSDRHEDPGIQTDIALIDAQGCDFLRTET